MRGNRNRNWNLPLVDHFSSYSKEIYVFFYLLLFHARNFRYFYLFSCSLGFTKHLCIDSNFRIFFETNDSCCRFLRLFFIQNQWFSFFLEIQSYFRLYFGANQFWLICFPWKDLLVCISYWQCQNIYLFGSFFRWNNSFFCLFECFENLNSDLSITH